MLNSEVMVLLAVITSMITVTGVVHSGDGERPIFPPLNPIAPENPVLPKPPEDVPTPPSDDNPWPPITPPTPPTDPTPPTPPTPPTDPTPPTPPTPISSCPTSPAPQYNDVRMEDTKEYYDGYNDAYDDHNYRPRNVDSDYMQGYEDGKNDKLDGKPNKFQNERDAEEESTNPKDCDLPTKGGGQDPLMVGYYWLYIENAEKDCIPDNKAGFDFDNDGAKEWICYNPHTASEESGLFTIDFGNGISHGYNILNFQRTIYDGMSAVDFLLEYPDICDYYDCYLWNDTNRDWEATDNELTEYYPVIAEYKSYPYDKKKECTYHEYNNRCIYGEGTFKDGKQFYTLMPVYWQNMDG